MTPEQDALSRRATWAVTLAVVVLVLACAGAILAVVLGHRQGAADQSYARGYDDGRRTALSAAECEHHTLRRLPRLFYPDTDLQQWRAGCLDAAADAVTVPDSWL